MYELGMVRGLRDRILLLLSLPALAIGCTSKGTTEAEAEAGGAKLDAKAGAPVAGQESAGQEIEPAPSTAIEPEPELPQAPDTGMDDEDGERAPAPLPEGAQFCFGLDDAKSLAASDSADEGSACPVELKLGEVRDRVESWDRRTGGPWDESVEFVVSDAPEGEGLRCCYEHAYARVPGVRPMRGRPLLAEGTSGVRLLVPQLPAATQPGEWLEDARVEHASVAAFARSVLELMALGAPPSLLRASSRAAVDELEHARACLEQAGLGADALGALEPVGARALSVAELAERTLFEACVPETLGALAAARSAARAEAEGEHEVARVRARIAEDEARHAALAWATLRWARSLDRAAVDARLAMRGPALRWAVADVLAAEPSLDEAEAPELLAELLAPLVAHARASSGQIVRPALRR